jgi:LPS sulfotransferase NodH
MSGIWDPLRPELDTFPPWDPPAAKLSYVVCSTPRSGSGLLCRALVASGCGGHPAEYFNPAQHVPLALRWQALTLATYSVALLAHRTDPDGVFGMKLHWDQLERIGVERLPEHFPGPVLIHVRRRDLDRQAVSLWTALHTNEWSRRKGAAPRWLPRPRYCFRAIQQCRHHIVEGELGWREFFEARGIEPISVVYEDMVADYGAAIRTVAARLRPGVGAVHVPPPDSESQADRHSSELAERFTADRLRRGSLYAPSIVARGYARLGVTLARRRGDD